MKVLLLSLIMAFTFGSFVGNAKKTDAKITVENVISKYIIFVQDTTGTNGAEIGAAFGKAYGEIVGYMQKSKIQFAGMPIAINITWDMQKNIFAFKAGIPVAKGDYKLDGRLQYGKTYQGKAIRAIHIGPYSNSAPVYEAITKYAKENGHEVLNDSWEEYINDPGQVKPEELETHIFMGIK